MADHNRKHLRERPPPPYLSPDNWKSNRICGHYRWSEFNFRIKLMIINFGQLTPEHSKSFRLFRSIGQILARGELVRYSTRVVLPRLLFTASVTRTLSNVHPVSQEIQFTPLTHRCSSAVTLRASVTSAGANPERLLDLCVKSNGHLGNYTSRIKMDCFCVLSIGNDLLNWVLRQSESRVRFYWTVLLNSSPHCCCVCLLLALFQSASITTEVVSLPRILFISICIFCGRLSRTVLVNLMRRKNKKEISLVFFFRAALTRGKNSRFT